MKRTTYANTKTQTQPNRSTRSTNQQVYLDPEEVRARAYGLYLASGCQPNCAEQHWYQAEQQLLAEKSQKKR